MVKVAKRNGKIEVFKASKIAAAVKGSGVPAPIASTIASMIAKDVKGRKIVKSTEIMKKVFAIFGKVSSAKARWMSYKKK